MAASTPRLADSRKTPIVRALRRRCDRNICYPTHEWRSSRGSHVPDRVANRKCVGLLRHLYSADVLACSFGRLLSFSRQSSPLAVGNCIGSTIGDVGRVPAPAAVVSISGGRMVM